MENADEGEAEEGSSSILQNLRKRICRDRERHVEDANATVRSTVEAYLRLPLEEFRCLRFWKQYEEAVAPGDHLKKALLRVVKQHLTPPPSSTNVERLFSYGGLVATDHRASLSAEKLDHILFLRENCLMANFDLGWI